MTPGTSGFPGLDWGDDAAAVSADYPAATAAGGWAFDQPVWGKPARVALELGDRGLASITLTFGGFESMEACLPAWGEVRATIDAEYGGGAAENLAAYWASDSHKMILSCDPADGDGDGATLSAVLQPHDDEE